jgi:peptide/nickel transport system substrate-binding protein
LLKAIIAISALACLPAAAGAQGLTMAVGTPVTSLDPHFHNQAPNNALADVIFDTLVQTDEKVRLLPGLAESWRAVGEDVWEFKLRPNVTFHNGRPFTADDVAFSIARVPQVVNSPGTFSGFVRAIQRVEVVDPLTVRMHMGGPYPLLPTDLFSVRMLNRATHEGATTEDFNSGRLAIGTGPYRLRAYRTGSSPPTPRAPRRCWRGMWISSTKCPPATSRSCAATSARRSARSPVCASSSWRWTAAATVPHPT